MVCLIDKVTFAAEIFTGGVVVMGKLVVIEGSDGSGKATQTKLLCERLPQSRGRAGGPP